MKNPTFDAVANRDSLQHLRQNGFGPLLDALAESCPADGKDQPEIFKGDKLNISALARKLGVPRKVAKQMLSYAQQTLLHQHAVTLTASDSTNSSGSAGKTSTRSAKA
jgi:hypothetical protein